VWQIGGRRGHVAFFQQLFPAASADAVCTTQRPYQEGSIRRMMTGPTSNQRTLKKSLLTIVWMMTTGVFAALLLHPSVPGAIRSVFSRPNRLATEAVEYGAHVAVFFVGTQFALICLEGTNRGRFFAILSLAAVVGISIEVAQTWVPTRGVDVFDALCNLVGISLAALAYRKMFRLTPKPGC
jgi:VanZ family protein